MRYRTVIIDGCWIARRAYEVGGRQGLIEGFLSTVLMADERFTPQRIYIAWDAHGVKTIRHAMNDGYKAGRTPPGDQYFIGMDQLLNGGGGWACPACGQEGPSDTLTTCPSCDAPVEATAPGVGPLPMLGVTSCYPTPNEEGLYGEGDDVAYTVVNTEPGPHLLISRDKDWLQMLTVGAEVGVLRDTKRGAEVITPETVEEVTGLTAVGWHTYLVLRGDTTDKIPGLPKVGADRGARLARACPTMVDMLTRGLDDGVMRVVDAVDPQMAQYARKAIDSPGLVDSCREQVQLYQVPFDRVEGPLDALGAADWLKRNGGPDWMARRVAAQFGVVSDDAPL